MVSTNALRAWAAILMVGLAVLSWGGAALAEDEVAAWPSAEKTDYRPAKPGKDDAKADAPPAWFLYAYLLGGSSTPAQVRLLWTSWKADERERQMADVIAQNAEGWTIERGVKKPVLLPRSLTASMTDPKASEPAWVRTAFGAVYDPNEWGTLKTADKRRDFLDDARIRELRAKDQEWNDKHAAEIEAFVKEQRERAAGEKPKGDGDAEAKEKARKEEARKTYAVAKEKALKSVEAGDPLKVISKPADFAGKTVRLTVRWSETVGRGSHADDFGGEAVMLIALSPPLRPTTKATFAMDLDEYTASAAKFEGYVKSKVEVVVFMLGDALDPEAAPAIGRIISVQPAK